MSETQKRQVLILDDEKLLVDIYKQKLEQSGYVVTPFYFGDDALIALRKGFDPDVVLFDLTMPEGMSGYEFLERVMAEGLNPRSVKIALTNQGHDGEIMRVMQLGASAHWLKSQLLPREIVAGVESLLKEKNS